MILFFKSRSVAEIPRVEFEKKYKNNHRGNRIFGKNKFGKKFAFQHPELNSLPHWQFNYKRL